MIKKELYERWMPVEKYEGVYEVSNFGRVRSIDRIVVQHNGVKRTTKGTLLSLYNHKSGYVTCHIQNNGKSKNCYVHILVANSFLGYSSLQVDHEDANKSNNFLTNLSYKTCSENILKAYVQVRKKVSIYPYVSFKKNSRGGKWFAYEPITQRHIGKFFTEIDAYNAYLNHTKNI